MSGKRKKWSPQTEITPELLRIREKKKWQIALRRYVLENNPSISYAPYFGLGIEYLRKWFESQFSEDQGWPDFGKKWQFGHFLAVSHFDLSQEQDLKLCWNFINLRVEDLTKGENFARPIDLTAASFWFESIYKETGYEICRLMLLKIHELQDSENLSPITASSFILEHQDYIKSLTNFGDFEFELINKGRSPEEAQKESQFLRNLAK